MTELIHATDTVGWYAILTQPQRESRVMDELSRHGVYSFRPVEKKWRVRRLVRKVKDGKMMPDGRQGYYIDRPILPGYVFTKLAGVPRWHVIKDLPFISGVLGHNGSPMRLSFEDLDTLYELRERAEVITDEGETSLCFKPGDQVRVTENPALEGFVQEVLAVDPSKELAYLRDLCILGRHLPVPYANLVAV